jgi:hypothetical protein
MPEINRTNITWEARTGRLRRSISNQNFEMRSRDLNFDVHCPNVASQVKSRIPALRNFQVQERGGEQVRTRITSAMRTCAVGKKLRHAAVEFVTCGRKTHYLHSTYVHHMYTTCLYTPNVTQPHLNIHFTIVPDQLKLHISSHSFTTKYLHTDRIPTYVLKIHPVNSFYSTLTWNLKTGMILAYITVNNNVSHNVLTLWMYIHMMNNGLRMAWQNRHVA